MKRDVYGEIKARFDQYAEERNGFGDKWHFIWYLQGIVSGAFLHGDGLTVDEYLDLVDYARVVADWNERKFKYRAA